MLLISDWLVTESNWMPESDEFVLQVLYVYIYRGNQPYYVFIRDLT